MKASQANQEAKKGTALIATGPGPWLPVSNTFFKPKAKNY
jgi:hypothetical protein